MTQLHFACTECGKCCGEAPEMSVLEALGLGDVFVPSISYKLTRVPKDDNEAGFASLQAHPDFAEMDRREFVAALRDSVAVRAGVELTGEPGWDSYLFITSRPWHYQRVGCPALVGMRCGVHERRPLTCRTVPLRYDVPAKLLARAFERTVTRGKAAADPYECDTSDAAPVFLDGSTVLDTTYASDRAKAVADAVAERELAMRLFTSPYLPNPREVIERLRKQGPFSVSFHAAVIHARELDKLDDARMRAFCEAQIALIDEEVGKALARKRSDERDWTARMRALGEAYRTILRGS